jgi:hypothetical protein
MRTLRAAVVAASLALAAMTHAVPAGAQSYSDILGRWCGDRSNRYVTILDFMADSFSVTWQDTNDRRVHRIIRYELGPGTIRVHWYNGNTATWTEYGEFSPDGQRMLQLPTRGTPLYIFYRC